MFNSILFARTEDKKEVLVQPDFFVDLNLDQIIEAVTAGKEEYDLQPFFFTVLENTEAIQYRQEIMKDLENEVLFEQIKKFGREMRNVREQLAQSGKLHYKYQKASWFLGAIEIYCQAVTGLITELSHIALKSCGLLAFRDYVTNYGQSEGFTLLRQETKKLRDELLAVKYCLLIKDNYVEVRKYNSDTDYSIEVQETFAKFRQGAVKDYRVNFTDYINMNHIEAGILDLVAQLHSDLFLNLDSYCEKNRNFMDETLAVFDREIQFYIAYLEFIAVLKKAGLSFCYPQVSNKGKEIYNYEGFDLALANKLVKNNSPLVCNDFYLENKERILVVSGPNQGGKTTFARTFGQLHYLACLGCPVPGREARLFLFDRLFTHFEKEESIQTLSGKLQDELLRIHHIVSSATSNSIIIMNEIFTSTTLQDAVFLGKQIMAQIVQLDLLCVCVTFIDELASFSEQTVSLVSNIVPENPALRTFKIVRKPADGLSYAISVAEKYRLTYDCLKERIKS